MLGARGTKSFMIGLPVYQFKNLPVTLECFLH